VGKKTSDKYMRKAGQGEGGAGRLESHPHVLESTYGEQKGGFMKTPEETVEKR